MNRKLLVTLLHKNIEELSMITESFMDMTDYPQAIVHLARRKTEDIQMIIDQLSEIEQEKATPVADEKPNIKPVIPEIQSEQLKSQPAQPEPEPEKLQPKEPKPVVETIVEPEPSAEEIEIIDLVEEEIVVVETAEETRMTLETNVVTETTEVIGNHEVKTVTDETKKTTIADKIVHPVVSRNEMMAKSDNTLSSTIANKKIDDIKQAISIGDRFRFQRELFKGNGEDMNKTLSYINQLATLNEVVSFLQSKYGWEEETEAAEDFMQIVKRKFL